MSWVAEPDAWPTSSSCSIAGLATGAIYALVAIGFTLLWQTSQTINFAQGEFVMLPAFFVLAGMKWLGLPFWLAVAARHRRCRSLMLGAAVQGASSSIR